MHDTKLILALKKMTNREHERFLRYVENDFFNQRLVLRELCQVLLEFAPDFSPGAIVPVEVHNRVFSKSKPYNALIFNNLASDLLNLLYEFLLFQDYEKKHLDRQIRLTELLLELDLQKHATSAHKKTMTMLKQEEKRSSEYFRMEQRCWTNAEKIYNLDGKRSLGEHLLYTAEAADVSMVIEKLKLCCAMVAHNKLAVVQGHFEPRWMDQFLDWCVADEILKGNKAVQTYVKAIELIQHPGQTRYHVYMDVLQSNAKVFSNEEIRALYQYALNYCIKRINDGYPDSYPQTLTLYQALLNGGLLLQQGFISQWTYKNIATTGLRCGAFGWTERFIRQYRELLPANEKDNAFAYNLGTLYFEQKKYGKALQTLQSVEFTDFSYHLGAKIMQMKIYYLLGEYEALSALVATSSKLIQRNKSLSEYGKTANQNFIKSLKILMKAGLKTKRFPLSVSGKNKLILEEIEVLQPLSNKEWLREVLGA